MAFSMKSTFQAVALIGLAGVLGGCGNNEKNAADGKNTVINKQNPVHTRPLTLKQAQNRKNGDDEQTRKNQEWATILMLQSLQATQAAQQQMMMKYK